MTALGRWLEALGVPRQDRGDLAQEVLFAATRSFASFDPTRARLERWLNGITVHVVAHERDRARYRREALVPDTFFLDLVDESPRPDEQLAAARARRAAQEIVAALDPVRGSVLVRHDIEGVPMVDVAAEQRIPVSTAYKRRARAVTALRQLARERGWREEG